MTCMRIEIEGKCHNVICLPILLDLPFATKLSTLIKHFTNVKKIPPDSDNDKQGVFNIETDSILNRKCHSSC